jgi:hypothetical protein
VEDLLVQLIGFGSRMRPRPRLEPFKDRWRDDTQPFYKSKVVGPASDHAEIRIHGVTL